MKADSQNKWSFFGIDVRAVLRDFIGVLLESTPDWLKSAFFRPPIRIAARTAEGRLRFSRISEDRLEEFGALDFESLPQQPAGLLAAEVDAFAVEGGGATLLELQLDDAVVLNKRLELPARVEQSLRQTVSYQLGRLTPFDPDQVYFDVRVVARDKVAKRITAELVVVAKEVCDPLLQAVERVTSRPVDRLTTASLGGEINLLGSGSWKFLPNRNFYLLLVMLLCLGLAIAAPLEKKRAIVIQQKQQINELRSSVANVMAKKQSVAESLDAINYMINAKRENPPITRVISELSRILPDSVYLFALTVKGNKVNLNGEGDGVVALIEALEASPYFEQVKFNASVARNAGTGLDRFSISLQLAGTGQ